MTMRVGYNKWVGIVFIVLSVIELILCLLIGFGGGNPIKTLIPTVLTLSMGILYLQRPYFEFDGKQLVILPLWGPLKKTYMIERPEDLEIIQNRIYLHRQKIRIYKWLTHPLDWQYFLDITQETKRVSP